MASPIRVRFAPSPTGFLHVGGARTALYNWLFARHEGGTFILRIEDTDVERSTEEAVRAILDGLRWLNLDWDEGPEVGGPAGPYRQAERFDRYREEAGRLLRAGQAYPCTCAPDALEAKRKAAEAARRPPKGLCPCRAQGPRPGQPEALRFAVPDEGEIAWEDLIHGPIGFEATEIEDFIIVRSDGMPVYNFAAAVDDALMRVTHVIRGDDHISNTPRQILLYRALGHPVPAFGHIPLILGPDRKKLSKRHGDTALEAYREKGYLPEAMVNYLVRLGWSHGDQEIFSRDELIRHFTLAKVGETPAVFDAGKLEWVNAQYIRTAAPESLVPRVLPFWEKLGVPRDRVLPRGEAWLARAVALFQERARTLAEMAETSRFLFGPPGSLDPGAAARHLTPEGRMRLGDLCPRLAALPEFAAGPLEALYRAAAAEAGLKLVDLAQPTRVALTGRAVSPPIFPIMELLGRDAVLARLREAAPQESPVR